MKKKLICIITIICLVLLIFPIGNSKGTDNEEPLPLSQVKYWAYQIQDVPNNADLLEHSRYEMLVIEPTRTDFSDEDARAYNTKELVTRLKASAGNNQINRKLVIAYIDIGQAEDWRWYWNWSVDSDWDPSETNKPSDWPSWIITHDPEWIGCFPVAYWHQDWQRIVIDGGFSWNGSIIEVITGDQNGGEGYNSILDEVVKDGFDGIYLDWVEAFSDEAVIEVAEAADIDPVDAMFDFIEAMRQYGRTRFQEMGRDPDEWIIIQQNAPDLAVTNDTRKFTVIDGIAEEGVWWEGTGDAGWDDPTGYDVSAKEKLGVEWYNDVLNVWLPAYKQAGIPVFACEYALKNAEDVYKNLSPSAGFIPYCTRRSLSRLTTTPPPGYNNSLNNFHRDDDAYRVDIPKTGSFQNPAWSPDNRSILFTRFRNGYNEEPSDLLIMDLENRSVRTLVSNESGNINLPGSSWNPVTHKIIFSSSREPHDEIFIIDENGNPGDETRITDREDKVAYEPSFSPDGQWIVFESHQLDVEENGVITKYKTDGTEPYQELTGTEEDCRQPNWSPAGNLIVYQKFADGQWDIWVMNINGTNHGKVTTGTGNKTDASFSPDGEWIVYSSDEGGLEFANLFMIPVSGNNPVRITQNEGYDGAPSWSPDGNRIAFESCPRDPASSNGTTVWIINVTLNATPTPRTITGHVYISGTNTPIKDATVSTSTGGYSTTTDYNGHYSLTIFNGTYTLTVSADGYESTSASVAVSGADVNKDFYLTQTDADEEEGEDEDGKGFIPGFEATVLIAMIGVCIILLRRRKNL